MKKARVIERTDIDGRVHYVIQRKYLWWWGDAIILYSNHSRTASFDTLEQAKRHLCYFDGTKVKERIISEGGSVR